VSGNRAVAWRTASATAERNGRTVALRAVQTELAPVGSEWPRVARPGGQPGRCVSCARRAGDRASRAACSAKPVPRRDRMSCRFSRPQIRIRRPGARRGSADNSPVPLGARRSLPPSGSDRPDGCQAPLGTALRPPRACWQLAIPSSFACALASGPGDTCSCARPRRRSTATTRMTSAIVEGARGAIRQTQATGSDGRNSKTDGWHLGSAPRSGRERRIGSASVRRPEDLGGPGGVRLFAGGSDGPAGARQSASRRAAGGAAIGSDEMGGPPPPGTACADRLDRPQGPPRPARPRPRRRKGGCGRGFRSAAAPGERGSSWCRNARRTNDGVVPATRGSPSPRSSPSARRGCRIHGCHEDVADHQRRGASPC